VKGKKISWNVNCNDFTMDVLVDGLSLELIVSTDKSITVLYFRKKDDEAAACYIRWW
jgi:hypothetical protein